MLSLQRWKRVVTQNRVKFIIPARQKKDAFSQKWQVEKHTTVLNKYINSYKVSVLPCRQCAMPCFSLVLSFQMIEPRAKHTEDYAPCSITDRQKTKESACVQADWQVHHHRGNKSAWQQHKCEWYQRNAREQNVCPCDKALQETVEIKRT